MRQQFPNTAEDSQKPSQGLEPGQVRLVAAHDWDVTDALRAGCAVVFVTRPDQVMNPFGPQPDVRGGSGRGRRVDFGS